MAAPAAAGTAAVSVAIAPAAGAAASTVTVGRAGALGQAGAAGGSPAGAGLIRSMRRSPGCQGCVQTGQRSSWPPPAVAVAVAASPRSVSPTVPSSRISSSCWPARVVPVTSSRSWPASQVSRRRVAAPLLAEAPAAPLVAAPTAAGESTPWAASRPTTPSPSAAGSKNASCIVPVGAAIVTVKSSYVSSGAKPQGTSEEYCQL